MTCATSSTSGDRSASARPSAGGGVRRRTPPARRPGRRWRDRRPATRPPVCSSEVDLALLVQPVDQVAALVGQQHRELDGRPRAGLPRRRPAPPRCPPPCGPTRRRCAARRARSRASTSGSAASALLMTTSSGTLSAWISARTSRTAASWPSGSGCEPSTTCRIRSDSATSSSVERNASTSWWGRCRTKPTVSDIV